VTLVRASERDGSRSDRSSARRDSLGYAEVVDRFARTLVSALAFGSVILGSAVARAEPTEPVVIGWWTFFDDAKYDTTSSSAHAVTAYGDPDTYYYEPSGGHGMQELPTVLPPATAWDKIVSWSLAKSSGVTLAPEFTIDTTSDLNMFTEARFGWAFLLLYVPKDKFCDDYRVHVGPVDDGVEVLANAKILGYQSLRFTGDDNVPLKEFGTGKLVLRPGINEVVIIHEDQQAVARNVKDVYITHNGTKIPLAPKSIVWGRVTDAATKAPIYLSKVSATGPGGLGGTFVTGPFGFYFFDKLADGAYTINAAAPKYKLGTATGTVKLGTASTEAVRVDLALSTGCECPAGKKCGPSGECLDPCISSGEFTKGCKNPGETCIPSLDVCVKDPCDTLTCKPGFSCSKGTCVEDACTNVCCGPTETCSGGKCVPNKCPSGGCLGGKICAGGECVDPCTTLDCVKPLTCKDGTCLDPCVLDPPSCVPDSGPIGDGGFGSDSAPPGDASIGDDSGGIGDNPDSEASGGCGCHASSGASTPLALLSAAGAIAVSLARRRRKRH